MKERRTLSSTKGKARDESLCPAECLVYAGRGSGDGAMIIFPEKCSKAGCHLALGETRRIRPLAQRGRVRTHKRHPDILGVCDGGAVVLPFRWRESPPMVGR